MKGRRLGEVSLGRLLAGSQNCRNEVLKRRQKNDVVIKKREYRNQFTLARFLGFGDYLKINLEN